MPEDGGAGPVAAVRAFNRFYTGVIGAVRGAYLDSPYSLTEARVLFELAGRELTEVADLRAALDIDAGYLSRILARFDADKLITRQRSATDARRQVIGLTGAGRAAFEDLDSRSAGQAGDLLGGLGQEDLRRLLAAMGVRSEEHTSELQSRSDLVCRLLLEKKKKHKHNILIYRNENNRLY